MAGVDLDVSDIPIVFMECPSAESTAGAQRVEVTWGAFVTAWKENGFLRVSKKSETPQLIPAEFEIEDQYLQKDEKHCKWVTVAVLDCDGEKAPGEKKSKGMTPEEVDTLYERIRSEGLEAFIYTTYGHVGVFEKHGRFKLRAMFPLSRAVDKTEWSAFWKTFNGTMGGLGDRQCSDPVHGYLEPSVHVDAVADAGHFMEHIQGKALDVDFMLSGSDSLSVSDSTILTNSGGDPVSRDRVKQLARRFARSSQEYKAWMGELILKMLKGERFAEEGERDVTIYKMAQDLGAAYPEGSAASLAQLFEQSLSHMEGEEDAITVEDVQKKIIRAQQQVLTEQAQKQRDRSQQKETVKEAFGVGKYSKEDIVKFCEMTQSGNDPKRFKERLIIQKASRYYVFKANTYRCHTREELTTVCRDAFHLVDCLGANVYNIGEKGTETLKRTEDLMSEYGVVADRVEMRLSAQRSFFEERTRTMVEAVRPFRNLKAEKSSKVDIWMRMLCSDDGQYTKLRRWMSLVPDLDRSLSMLCLVGAPGVGKTEFANGIARLWNAEGAQSLSLALGHFNEELGESPLLLADEGLPRNHRGQVKTEELRSFTSRRTHSLNMKNLRVVPIIGYFRVVVAVNDIGKINLGKAQSKDDISAIQQRLLVINVNPAAKELFDYKLFVEQDMLAKHALWLHENLKVEEGEEVEHVRFGVSSGTGIQMLDDTSNSVLEWVFKYLDNRRKLETESDMPVFIAKGQVFTHIEKMIKYWDTFFETKPPTLREMQRVVGVIGDKYDRIFVGESGQRRRYWGVSKDILETWIRQNDLDETFLKLQLLVYSDSRKHFIMPKKLRPTEDDLVQREEARRGLEELKDLDPDEPEVELIAAQ